MQTWRTPVAPSTVRRTSDLPSLAVVKYGGWRIRAVGRRVPVVPQTDRLRTSSRSSRNRSTVSLSSFPPEQRALLRADRHDPADQGSAHDGDDGADAFGRWSTARWGPPAWPTMMAQPRAQTRSTQVVPHAILGSVSDAQPADAEVVRDFPALLDAARDMACWVEGTLGYLKPVTLRRLVRDPFVMIGRSVTVRQATSLRAALTLVDAGIGHAALPMVRPACDELIWVKYLATLSAGERGALLHILNSVEGSELIGAQAEHLGPETMTAVGFPPHYVEAVKRQLTEGERLLTDAGKTLGWPKSPPAVWWLAKQVGLADMYRFLYTATCKGVHFSVTEHLRSGYNDSTPDGPITLAAPAYVAYRSGFIVYWLCDLLVHTLAEVVTVIPDFKDATGPEEDDFLSIIKRVAAYGKMPIVMPFEYNLP